MLLDESEPPFVWYVFCLQKANSQQQKEKTSDSENDTSAYAKFVLHCAP